jgi:hypothetical protein
MSNSQDEKNQVAACMSAPEAVVEGVDYTIENGFFVFTGHYLLKRGFCCGSGCRNCPYVALTVTAKDGLPEVSG